MSMQPSVAAVPSVATQHFMASGTFNAIHFAKSNAGIIIVIVQMSLKNRLYLLSTKQIIFKVLLSRRSVQTG